MAETMKLALYSDLHLEFSDWTPPTVDADVVVLAGDISTGTKAVAWAVAHFAGQPILYVPGNHEFYGHNVSTLPTKLREAAAGSNVHMLMRDELILDGVRFLGCTLWTDYRLYSDRMGRAQTIAMDEARSSLNDHRKIGFGSNHERFSPHRALQQHDLDKQWLADRLTRPFDGKTVVITHHAPSLRSVAPEFIGDSLTPCFASNLESMMAGADLWGHGHTHNAVDYRVGQTRVVCNPRGYETYAGREHTGWQADLIIEV